MCIQIIYPYAILILSSSFPSFVGVAVDKDVPKDADIPAQRRTNNGDA